MKVLFRKSFLATFAFLTSAVMDTTAKAVDITYAFAEQKAYNMTLVSLNNAGNLFNGAFNISTNTSASLTGYAGQTSNFPALDAQQSYTGTAPKPVENLSGLAVQPNTQQVLTQFNVTPDGLGNALVNNLPTASSFTQPTFSRSDALSRNPSSSSTLPISSGYLFNPAFGGGNVSIDSASESLMYNLQGNSLAQSGWQISGSFSLANADVVKLGFDVINRLVGFSNINGQVASASTTLSLQITNQAFPFSTVYNPSAIAYSLSFPVVGSTTQNTNGTVSGWISPLLSAGNYNFTISGNTRTEASITVPEPSSFIMLGLCPVTIGIFHYRRKLLNTSPAN